MKRNYLHNTLWLVLVVLIALLGAFWLPDIEIFGTRLRHVDLLADVTGAGDDAIGDSLTDLISTDSIVKARRAEFVDSCKAGMTCIEDYSDDHRGMEPLYEALNSLSSLGRPVRIAVLGDSYIEGDIFTADLRNMLQKRYGGCGVGFVNITSETYGFRRSVIHRFGGWRDHISTTGKSYNHDLGIITGHYFIPDSAAWMQLSGQRTYCSLLDSCRQSSIYFMSRSSNTITASVNGGQSKQTFDVSASDAIQKLTVDGNIRRIRWTSSGLGRDFIFYGAAMDATSGIVLDNFSLRGSPGSNLANVHDDMIAKFHQVRPYDLIILMYGLNVATSRGVNYDSYKRSMIKAIEKLKQNMPGTGFLLVSVSDREERKDGKLRTMRGVKNLVRYQQAIAADGGIAFWNLYEAMGGDGSIAEMVNAKEANLDYTHINFRGGRRLAKILFETLEYGKDRYNRRKAYERKETQR